MREATERLLELGLSDKEAHVYLAMLELGPTGVNEIAMKADVNRSTTYALIESLKRRGLASMVQQDGKVIYTAESPKRLESLLSSEKAQLEDKERKLEETIPYFMALFNAVEDKPQVRFFEGEEGIATARDALMSVTGEYLSFTAIDEGTMRMSKINEDQRLRMARRLRGKLICSVKEGCVLPAFDAKYWQVRQIPYETFPFTGEINIVGDKVAAYVVKNKPMAFLVESSEMSDLFRALFGSAWLMAKPVEPPRP